MARETSSGDVSERAQFAYGPDDVALPRPAKLPPPREALRSLPVVKPSTPAWLPALRNAVAQPTKIKIARSLATALLTEFDRGTPFALVPVFLALGVIIYYGLANEPAFTPLLAGAAILTVFLALLPSRRRVLHFTLAAVLICLGGMVLAKLETWRTDTKMLGGEISTRLIGRVAALDHLANGRVRLTIDVLATARPTLRYVPGRVRVSARKIPPGLVVGSEIEGAIRLMPPSGPVRPDSYDFSFSSYFDSIGASGFFLRGPELVQPLTPASMATRFSNGVENIRNAIADRIRSHIGGPEGEIAAALVVGIRAGIPEDINEAMRRTGIYHIISISGLHMALVAGTVMGTLRAAFALFPSFASRRPVKKYAAATALAAIAGYLFISGGEVAAQRSFIMLAIMLIAVLFDRGALTMRNLSISAIVVIAISPHEVVGPSFQMSFAATTALIGAYALWSERRRLRKSPTSPAGKTFIGLAVSKTSGAVGALVMTSVVAGIATTAFGAYHFQRVSPLSLVANFAVMPITSILVMPFAVGGSLAMPLGLDGPLFYVMGKGLTLMILISQWISERSPIDAVGQISPHSLALLTLALVIATMATTWLRALAVPFALVGALTLTDVRAPDVFVSEDGRLIAVPIGNERLAVNRARPNAFTVDNWKRALRAETIVAPVDTVKAVGSRKQRPTNHQTSTAPATAAAEEGFEPAWEDENTAPLRPAQGASIVRQETAPDIGFDCHDGLCLAVHTSGAIIAHAADARIARRACGYANLIVVDDATAQKVCAAGPPLIITKRELSKFGSAVVYLPRDATGRGAEVRYALDGPYRPWHEHRKFSREARGLLPYNHKPAANLAKARAQPQKTTATYATKQLKRTRNWYQPTPTQ